MLLFVASVTFYLACATKSLSLVELQLLHGQKCGGSSGCKDGWLRQSSVARGCWVEPVKATADAT